MYDMLVTKVSAISVKVSSISELISKTKYDSDKNNLNKKLKVLIRRYLIIVN